MFRKEVLDNGVRVVTERIPSVRSVSIGIWVDVGSRDEQPGEEGFSHFIEHMVFKGTRRRSAEAISGEVATIEALRRAPLLSFRARHYRPSQVVVAVAGNFAFGPVLKQLASAFGGPWDSETGSAHRVPPTVTKGVHVRSKPLEQAHICGRAELERAKSQLKGNLMLGLESTSSRMSKLAKDELYFGCHIPLRQVMADIDAISADQLWRLSRELFDDRFLALTALGPLQKGDVARVMQ